MAWAYAQAVLYVCQLAQERVYFCHMTRILITGASGFAGTHLIAELQATTTAELWALGRQPHPVLPSVVADLLDPAALKKALADVRPQQIIHLAAQASVQAAFAAAVPTYTTNILGQLHMFEAIRELQLDPLVLVVSSNEVYGMVQPADIPVNEQTPFRPANPYAVSKAAQDLMAGQWFYSYGLRAIRVRPFNHLGPHQRPDFVAAAFAQQIARIEHGLQEPVLQVGNLAAERDWTDVRDMVRAYRLALDHCQPGAAYNIGSGQAVAVQRLLDILLSFSTVTIDVQQDPARMRPSDVPTVACDASRFKQQTGWQPQYSLEQTLRDVLDDWRSRVANHSVT